MLLECFLFNLPFWRSLPASTDTAAASNSLGSGIERTREGLIRVTDPTQAYLELKADGSSAFSRIDLTRPPNQAKPGKTDAQPVLSSIHVRLDGDGQAGHSTMISSRAPESLYLQARARSTLRLWIQEPVGSLVPISAVRANIRVPFHYSLGRLCTMVLIAILLACWRPGSRLWRIGLNTGSGRQRLALTAFLLACGGLTIAGLLGKLASPSPLVFHSPGNYTYDFDQYGHLADALLRGHGWLDLPVPDALAQSSDPYRASTREQLLAQGVSPIYWDYAFYQGHWYSYFGILPALLLFAPYRLLSQLWIPGGAMLPATAAVGFLAFGFLAFGSLLIIRLIGRLAPHTSLAAVSMALAAFFLGSNLDYLLLRSNFYSVPFCASLLLTSLGLWLWMGAADRRHKARIWSGQGVAPLSLPHLSGGALCLAANLGCRPTFALSALLAFPLFWPQISALWQQLTHHQVGLVKALRAPAAIVLPALLLVLPLVAYNMVRFGSPGDFGNNYQLTVTDMTNYRPAAGNLPTMLVYYLFLPLRWTPSFPFLAISPTPLPHWAYHEPMVGGFFALCPVALLVLALPWTRRKLAGSRSWPLLMTGALLGVFLLVFDAYKGGLGWRYMTDFGWYMALGAIPVMLLMLGELGPASGTGKAALADADLTTPKMDRPSWSMRLRRLLVLALLLASLVLLALSCFVPGRDDALITTDPDLFFSVQTWFRWMWL
ncbi:glycosyltransferase [Bifidobacterium aemilianum]|nr:glycosyltransferase [Bifidobacterium aemilianum]